MSRAQVLSFGGGTQSAAIAVLVAQGTLPRPERVVIADTGREASETWAYLDAHIRPLLASVGLAVDVVPHTYATVDLHALNGDLLIPAYTAGGDGKLPTYCSTEWKTRVIRRWLREQGYGPHRPVDLWLGFSTDEAAMRAKDADVAWVRHRFPIAMWHPLSRTECVRLVERAGLPTPPRSRCWMCPHQGNAEWRDLRDRHPRDFAEAVALDEAMRARDPNVFVHRSGVPLALANLDTDTESTRDGDLFAACVGESCWT